MLPSLGSSFLSLSPSPPLLLLVNKSIKGRGGHHDGRDPTHITSNYEVVEVVPYSGIPIVHGELKVGNSNKMFSFDYACGEVVTGFFNFF